MALSATANNTRSSARRAPRLPPLRLDSTYPPPIYMACPTDEKNGQLPCIIVTPSSPTHDTEFQIHYFAPEKPSNRSWFSWFSSAPSDGEIALPLNPEGNYMVYRPSNSGCSKARWLRTFLLLAIPLFIIFHLFLLPGAETHMMDVISSHRHQDTESTGHASNWESNDYSPVDDQFSSLAWDVYATVAATNDPAWSEEHATGTTELDDFTPTAPASDVGSVPEDPKEQKTQTGEL